MFSHRYRYLFIALLVLYSYWNTSFAEVFRYYPIPGSAAERIAAFLLIAIGVWEGDRLILYAMTKGVAADTKTLILFFIVTAVWASLISYGLSLALCQWRFHLSGVPRAITIKLSITLGTRINLFLQVVNGILYFFKRYRDKELETETLKRSNVQAQLQAIKNQINPHFLFNNLNVLSALVLQESPDANKFIEEFATVYRHVLNNQDKELVPLREEIEFMEHYLFLLKHRFPESIEVKLTIPDGYQNFLIIPVALQMLAENAIKHNAVSKTSPLRIKIYIDENEHLVVENNIQPRTTVEDSTRIGLKNINSRYELTTQQSIFIVETENRFRVALPLIKPVA